VKNRSYTSVERQRTVEAGRERIVAAARELLEDEDGEGFSIDAVAEFGPDDEARLMADAGIVRNRAKVAAAIANARAAQRVPAGLDALLWSFAPDPAARERPATLADVPATSPESVAMAKELKRRGFVFVGPTTAYALMQATGMVDDHVADCFRAGGG